MSDPFAWLDATAQAELVRKREVSPLELVDAAIRRIETLNPALNAVIIPLYEKARAAARDSRLPDGPFRGVPFVVKDMICHTAGDPFYEGMRFAHRLKWIEREDQHLATLFRQAGLVIVGKTNTPELGILPTTEPTLFGPTHNPWDPTRSPFGSSGGSAAAVASGMVPFAHANDGGGSIRLPASACGLVGLKPSRGRVSLGPDLGDIASGIVTDGVVTRSVRDAATALDIMSVAAPGEPYGAPPCARSFYEAAKLPPQQLRVGFVTTTPAGMFPTHPDCTAAGERAARLLESLGHHVESARPEAFDDPANFPHFVTRWTVYAGWSVDWWQRRTGMAVPLDKLEPTTRALTETSRSFTAIQYLNAVEWHQLFSRRMARWWTEFDLLVTPTSATIPPPLGETRAGEDQDPLAPLNRASLIAAFTAALNATGQPAISLPLHQTAAGLPVGVQLIAAYGREDLLLQVAAQLERAAPWASLRPVVTA